jgi:hypothetical protein
MASRMGLSLLLSGALVTISFAQDQPPAKAQSKPLSEERDQAILTQQRLASQYQAFEMSLLHLTERLERSKRPEDQERAKLLKEAIKKSSELAVDKKFDGLIELLRTNKSVTINEVKDAMDRSKMLADDIQTILALLLSTNSDAQRKAEKERLERLLKELERIIREEKLARAQTEAGKLEKGALHETQNKVTKATEKLALSMSKGGEPKDGKGSGQPKDGGKKEGDKKGDPQPSGKGSSQPKDGDKKEGDKKGQPQPPQSGDKPPQQDTPGRKQVQDAIGDQKKAEEKIQKDKKDEASNHQDEAIKKLEEVRKKLEDILRQLREEEQQRLLAALQQRCQMMLAIQIEVQEGTVRLGKAIAQNEDHHAGRSEEQRALQLSDRERQIVREAKKALELLETEGSAVAFPEVFSQVRDDAENVSRRLGKADVGSVTQGIEQDIIDTLKEMIEALKKAQQSKGGQSKPGEGKPGNQNLIDLIAELKMIRSLQVRVNQRTVVYARQYQGEQANEPDIQHELVNLAERQEKIFEVTNNLARGKNR